MDNRMWNGKKQKEANLEDELKQSKVMVLHGVKDVFKTEGKLCNNRKNDQATNTEENMKY